MYHDRKGKKNNKLNCKFEFRLNCKQRLMFHQGTGNDNIKFVFVDASQFFLCRNTTNCLLLMNKSARRCMFCKESVKHDKSVGLNQLTNIYSLQSVFNACVLDRLAVKICYRILCGCHIQFNTVIKLSRNEFEKDL